VVLHLGFLAHLCASNWQALAPDPAGFSPAPALMRTARVVAAADPPGGSAMP